MKHRPLFFGLLSGLVSVALLLLYLRKVEAELSGGKKVAVLVLIETAPRGKPITETMLGTREIPLSYLDDRVVRASDKSKILGLRSTTTVPVQQTLAWSDVLAAKDDQRSLSNLVQPGNRATPIRVHITDVLALVRPGDFVDVLCVCGDAKDATVLLQRVMVLAAGNDTSAPLLDGKDPASKRVTVLTLSTSLQESQLLAVAMEKGKLTAVVRNPNDQQIAELPADVSAQALTEAGRRQQLQSPRRHSPSSPTALKEVKK
jgi:pilus assembly protein CpaB